MTDPSRPNPDLLLAAVQAQEKSNPARGKLKIFFGMAAGVGKTYSMLEAAHQRKQDGVDVAIGYVETHNRADTVKLVQGLEIIPRRQIEYKGTILEEMDLDAILARRPQLVLVDELAHTNVEGVRHPKRYQDVLELLDAGIDVYTTVNVQHLESRADSVRQITGIEIRETVPDTVLDSATEIELIDLPPEQLRKRLAEGKIYTAERAELASRNFFRMGNLTALREMALRTTAERVDRQLRNYMQIEQIAGPWKSGERLMVAVSPSPLSERLVRWTRRIAYNLEADWLAVYVEPSYPISTVAHSRVQHTLSLARELGAEVVTAAGDDPVNALLHLAHQHNVSQIVVGKPERTWLQETLRGGSIVSRLIRRSGEIDVYVVTGEKSETDESNPFTAPIIHSGWPQYMLALMVVAFTVGVCVVLDPILGYQSQAVILLFMVLMLGLFVGRGPVLVAACISALVWEFVFIEPRFNIQISRPEDILLFVLYFAVAIVTGTLTTRLRSRERIIRQREERTAALYDLSREFARDETLDQVVHTAVQQLERVFKAKVALYVPDINDHFPTAPHPKSTLAAGDKERSVALWVYEHGQKAGKFTGTLSSSEAQHFPLRAPGGIVGVVSIKTDQDRPLIADMEDLVETFISQTALAVERELLDKAASRTEVLEESERLYSTLLSSISHEIRTPLAAITGAVSGLLDPAVSRERNAINELGQDALEAAGRLNRLVDNLLEMTRLEADKLSLNLQWTDVAELLQVTVQRMEKQLGDHPISIDVAPGLPLIRVDFVLMEHVLSNLVHNAAMYTPPGTRIQLASMVQSDQLVITVTDYGPGLPENGAHVFEKFYRGQGAAAGGTGLGLSICKGLVEAHGGTIAAVNHVSGGAQFTIRLPIPEDPGVPGEAIP